MPTATATSARRGSFLETWRVFAGGAGNVWFVVLFTFAALAMPMLFKQHHGAAARFAPLEALVVFSFGFATWHLEAEMGERLAFMTIVAQPVDTRRLLVVPMCVLGLVIAVAYPALGRLPAAGAPAILGIALGTIGGTRWLWRLRFWPLLLLPVLALNPVATYAAYRLAGWGGAAAVSLALGIGALTFQPRPYVGEPLSRLLEGGPASARFRGRAARGATSTTGGSDGWLASAVRFMQLSFGTGGFLFIAIIFVLTVPVGLIFPIGRTAQLFIWMGMIPGKALANAYSGDMHEFLRPRPFNRRERFVGGVIPPVLLALIVPLTALCFVNLDWINHCGVMGLFKSKAPGGEEIGYLRVVLGASFLPDKWPDGGLPQHLWVQLRPLLYLDVLRAALMIVALLFAFPIRKVGERAGMPWLSAAIMLAAFATMGRVAFFDSFKRWPLPPAWFLALLAGVSIAQFAWRARAMGAPARGAA